MAVALSLRDRKAESTQTLDQFMRIERANAAETSFGNPVAERQGYETTGYLAVSSDSA
ncbi:MAG: hypothetical protein FD138_31 [Planctomycetota bacterium]|nr:MAG: hypothetical protein FD138_31 [Planctomycetota bacterium]